MFLYMGRSRRSKPSCVGRAMCAREVEALGLSLETPSAQDHIEKREKAGQRRGGVLNSVWKRLEMVV